MRVFVVILVVAVLAAAYFTIRAMTKRDFPMHDPDNHLGEEGMVVGDFVIVPSSVSKERVSKTGLPPIGSEDMRHLLVVPPLEPKDLYGPDTDYRPIDLIEWVIDVQFDGDPVLQRSKLERAFGREWLEANGTPTIYGWSPDIKHWTFLVSGDSPKTFTRLCFGWRMFRRFDEEFSLTANDLERFRASTIAVAGKFGTPKATTNRSTADAIGLASQLNQLVDECGKDVVIILSASPGTNFEGRDVWDVMKCLGLEWGDGDVFHWINGSGRGTDYFFSVETQTPPGYFLPEQIAAGGVKLGDLVFSFSIPRCAAPEQVYGSMLRGVQYAQRRLRGTLLGTDGKSFNEDATRNEIRQIELRLRQAGLEVGSSPVLYIF